MSKTNVLFILTDDLGWKDLVCMGSEFYETPNIDRIAAEGMLFTDAYAAAPVCSPTRASILSGKYPARIGLTHYIGGPDHCKQGAEKGKMLSSPYVPYLPLTEKSIASAFKQHGYKTWHVGKWHLGAEKYWPLNHGFDVNIGGCHHGQPPGKTGYFAPWEIPALPTKDTDEYLTDRLGDEAVQLITENDDSPFFMYLSFYSVHTPIMAKPQKIKKYQQKARELGIAKEPALVEGDWYPCEHKKNQRIVRRIIQSDPVYAAMIEHLDENVGKVLDALDTKGVAQNTIVVFTSDNGGLSSSAGSPTCNAPLAEGKGWMYEGGCREPLFMRWPGTVQTGSRTNAVVSSPDFYPTLLEACGLPLEVEQHVDGNSFLSVLTGNAEEYNRGAVFWHYPHYGNNGGEPGCAIRKDNWKLIEFFGRGSELYDLANDISEQVNVIDQHPGIAQDLLGELHEWQKEVNALIPIENPDWEPWLESDIHTID